MAIAAADLLVNVRADVDDARRKIRALDDDIDELGGTFTVVGTAAKAFGIAAAAGFASIATAGAVSGITAFVGALAPMGGLLAAIPGALAGAGAAIATLALGLYGVKDAFKALAEGDMEKFNEALGKLAPNAVSFFRALQRAAPAFSALRLDVQNALFQGLGWHVDRLARVYIPALRPGMLAIAAGFNNAARGVADFLARADTVNDVRHIFANTGLAMMSLRPILTNIVAGLLDFASVGARLLPEFGMHVEGLSERFRAWADNARRTGQIEEWIRNGAAAAVDFGGILVNVAQIIGAVARAAQAAFGGEGLLQSLKENTQAVEDFLKSATGQTALIDFFTAVRAALTAITPVLREAFLAFTQGLIPALSALAVGVAPGLATALTAIKDALIILQPSFYAVGAAVGALLAAVAPLLPPLATFINDLIVRLGPNLPAVIGGIIAFAAAFKGLMIVGSLAPAFKALVGVIGFMLSPVGLAILAVAALAAGLVIAYKKSEKFRDVVHGAFQAVQDAADQFKGYWERTLWPAIQRVWEDIKSAFVGGEVTSRETMDRFRSLLQGVKEFVVTFGEAVKVAFQTAVTVIMALWDTFGETIVEGFQAALTAIMTIAEGVLEMITGVFNVFIGVLTGDWTRAWEGIKGIFSGAATALTGILDLLISRALLILKLGMDAIKGLFRLGWEAVKALFTGAIGILVGAVTALPGAILRALSPLAPGLLTAARTAWDEFKRGTTAKAIEMLVYVARIPGMVKDKFSNAGNLLRAAGEAIMNGLRDGIAAAGARAVAKATEMAIAVKNAAKSVLGINSPSKVMHEIGEWTGEGLANGLKAMETAVARAGAGMAAAAVPNVSAGQGLTPTSAGLTAPSAAAAGGGVTVAPGAFQVIVQGNITEAALPQVQDSVDAALRSLLAEINGGRIPGRVG